MTSTNDSTSNSSNESQSQVTKVQSKFCLNHCLCCCCNTNTTEDDKTSTTKCCSIPQKLRPHIPRSKKVYIVLLWILMTHGIYNYTIFNLGGVLDVGAYKSYPIYIIGTSQFIALILYPMAGIIGEVYWTRYKMLVSGTVLMLLALFISPFAYVGLRFLDNAKRVEIGGLLIAILLIPFQIGLAIFESNIIQFGTDQLLFASSDQLSNFVHWSFWCMYFMPVLVILLVSCPINMPSIATAPLVEVITLIIIIIIVLLPCSRRHLEIRQIVRKNPIKLVHGVLKYAKTHKYPLNRSAFTYNDEEPQNRINFAKKRYGGPYTTEEVEDVKTLGRIIVLLLSLFGFLLIDNTSIFIEQYKRLMSTTFNTGIITQSQCLIENYFVTYLVIIIGVPIYKLILTPFFYKFLPNMIKRMGAGLLVTLFSILLELAMSVLINNAFRQLGFVDACGRNLINASFPDYSTQPNTLLSQYTLIVPQFLNGFSLLLVFLTALEFILAQSPRSMQGLLVGFWYALQSVNVLLSTILSANTAGCSYISYAVRVGFASASFLLYIFAAYWYKGRIRQESSIIRQRTIIEEYTERNLYHDQQAMENPVDPNDPYIIGTYNLDDYTIMSVASL